MYCRFCGREIEDDSRFCGFCGRALFPVEAPAPPAGGTSSPSGPTPTASNEPALPHFETAPPVMPVNALPDGAHISKSIQQPGARRKRVVKIVSSIFLVLIVGLIGYGLWNHFSHPDPDSLDEAAYKKEAILISYEDFFDNTEEYDGILVKFPGTVGERGGKGSDSWFLLDTYYDPATSLYYGGTILVRGEEDLLSKYKAGEDVTVYGVTESERKTKTTATGTYDVPAVRVRYIDKP